jgi:hypothetical protein
MKKYLIELGWLLGTVFISYVLASMLIGNFSADINYHDIYFVIDFNYFYIICLFLLTTTVYLVRAIITRFGRLLVNVIFLITNLLSMTVIAALTFFMFKLGGETFYPPLSRLPETISGEKLGPNFYALLLLSISLLALNVFVAYRIYQLLKSSYRMKSIG